MSEFCLECWNKLNDTNYSKNEYIFSKELDLCEGCNEWKNVIVTKKEFIVIRLFLSLKAAIKSIYKSIFKR